MKITVDAVETGRFTPIPSRQGRFARHRHRATERTPAPSCAWKTGAYPRSTQDAQGVSTAARLLAAWDGRQTGHMTGGKRATSIPDDASH